MSPFAAIVDRRRNPIEPRTIDELGRALSVVGGGRGARTEPVVGPFWVVQALEPPTRGPGEARAGLAGFCLGAEGLELRTLRRNFGLEAGGTSAGEVLILGSTGPESRGRDTARLDSSLWASLTGSFALAVLEPGTDSLHLARDPLGERTLFFAEFGSLVLLADRIEILLRCGGSVRSLEASQLVRFFGLESPRPGKTYFRGIEEVEPGSSIRFTPEGRETSKFWVPEPDKPQPVKSDREFVEDFRAHLERSTASLLANPRRSGVMLSGGLDSTSLAVFAAHEAERAGERVAACSWLFDELGVCDERSGIENTLELHDFEVIQVLGDGCWPLADPGLFSNLAGTPEENPFRALKSALYSAAQERGRTLLLNGGTAEIFFRGGNLYFRDLLRDGRWGAACGGLARQLRQSGWRSAAGSVARVVRPTGRRKSERPPPLWFNENARRLWSEEMEASAPVNRGVRDVVPYLAMESRGMVIENLYSQQQGVRLASPYWTRGWVEFMLTLPAHQVYRPGTTKFIAREAMRGVIPEAIRMRQDPTLLDPLFDRGIFEREAKVVDDLLYGGNSVWQEFVDPRCVADLGPASSSAQKLVLWNCVSFELWRRKHGWEVG